MPISWPIILLITRESKKIAFVKVLVSASEMFSIAGMAEHPPASAAQPDTQPAQAGPTSPDVGTRATATEEATLPKHESVIHPRAVTLSAPLATLLAAQYTNAAEHMLLGKLQGRNQLSARELSTWCKKHLHSKFLHVTCLGLGYFEVAFSSPDGKEETLRRCGFGIDVVFSPWQPSFEPEDPACVNAFSYAIWVQFYGLNSLLRTKECLTEIGNHIGVVLLVEDDELNRTEVAGLRVRVLVSTEDLNSLPDKVELPQIGNYGGKTCSVMYSGLPERCNACATFAHSPQNCPLDLGDDSPEVRIAGQSDYYTTGKGKAGATSVVEARQERTISLRSGERVVVQQGNCCIVENHSPNAVDWVDAHGKFSDKASAAPANSQYTMTLSGPLSAPHSPKANSVHEAASRWTSSYAGVSALSTKFSSRPAFDL